VGYGRHPLIAGDGNTPVITPARHPTKCSVEIFDAINEKPISHYDRFLPARK
jgi:hypothetical protein